MFIIDEKYFVYDEPAEFVNGRFKVCINNKYGYIDQNGSLTVPAIYDFGTEFIKEHAIVKLNGEFFCIDKFGNKLNLFTHDEIASLINSDEYKSLLREEKISILNKLKSRENYNDSNQNNQDKPSEINVGLFVAQKSYGEIKYKNGYSIVDNKKIFKGKGMNIIADDGYPLLARFNNYIEIEPLDEYDDRFYKIKEKKYYKPFSEYSEWTSIEEKYGIIGKNGEIILDCEYDNIYTVPFDRFHNFYLVQGKKRGLAINDYPDKVHDIIPCEYEHIMCIGSKYFYAVKQNGKYALYTIYGKESGYPNHLLTDFIYDQIGIYCCTYEVEGHMINGVIPVRINDKMGIISDVLP